MVRKVPGVLLSLSLAAVSPGLSPYQALAQSIDTGGPEEILPINALANTLNPAGNGAVALSSVGQASMVKTDIVIVAPASSLTSVPKLILPDSSESQIVRHDGTAGLPSVRNVEASLGQIGRDLAGKIDSAQHLEEASGESASGNSQAIAEALTKQHEIHSPSSGDLVPTIGLPQELKAFESSNIPLLRRADSSDSKQEAPSGPVSRENVKKIKLFKTGHYVFGAMGGMLLILVGAGVLNTTHEFESMMDPFYWMTGFAFLSGLGLIILGDTPDVFSRRLPRGESSSMKIFSGTLLASGALVMGALLLVARLHQLGEISLPFIAN